MFHLFLLDCQPRLFFLQSVEHGLFPVSFCDTMEGERQTEKKKCFPIFGLTSDRFDKRRFLDLAFVPSKTALDFQVKKGHEKNNSTTFVYFTVMFVHPIRVLVLYIESDTVLRLSSFPATFLSRL